MKTAEGYKSIDTSRVTQSTKPNGVRVVDIEVETMAGLTTEMMVWWFHHFDRMTTWNGADFTGPARLAYRVWHPRDHIFVSQLSPGHDPSVGGCAEGATVRIQEKILCKHDFDATARVAQCDEENLDLHGHLGPLRMVRIEHLWKNVDGGCDMTLRLEVGADVPIIGRLINWVFRRFVMPDEMLSDAAQHGTEEFGNLENFLPQLYTHPEKLWKFEGAAWK